MDINHRLLDVIGVGHAKIDSVRECCRKYGVTSKITGAGGGGCMLLLLPNAPNQDQIVEQMQSDLVQRDIECMRCSLGVPGLTLHTTDRQQ
jgi:mevalonate kinase